jgi:DNA transformation protein and related proteins
MLHNNRAKSKQLDGLTIHVLDLLAPWQPVDAKRMFGGVGLFAAGTMFAIIIDEILYLKETLDAKGKPVPTDFERNYFEYDRNGKTVALFYYQVPEQALDDSSMMIELAAESYRSACSQPKKVKKRKLRVSPNRST